MPDHPDCGSIFSGPFNHEGHEEGKLSDRMNRIYRMRRAGEEKLLPN
jgi:hypothetical protein